MQKPLHVLLVEDVPSDAKLVVHQLRKDGLVIEWSRVDNEQDYRSALEQPIDVILSDCLLPVFSGDRAIDLLRESGLDMPLIIVSGTIGEEAAADLIRRGAADYVSKDRPGRLGMAVSRALTEAQLRRDRERALADVRRADARFRSLFESDVIGIIVVDSGGRILEANSYFLAMLGRSLSDLPLDLSSIATDQRLSSDRAMFGELRLPGGATPWESEVVRPDGTRIPVLMGGARLSGDCLVCFIVDLTQTKAIQAKLEEAKSQLETAIDQLRKSQDALIAEERLHALGQMAAGIAHDFNNSLSPIIGLSELILSGPDVIADQEKVLRYLATIHRAGRDAALVVKRLRDYYRESVPGEKMEVVDLKQVVLETIDLTQSKWRDEAMASNTEYRIVTELANAVVAGHASELREMLVNLIFNALDAMPHGGELTIAVVADAEKPGIVNLEVRDTGVGMTPEVQKRCFEPFFTTKGAAGTGLGLAASFGIVKRHHGEVRIESAPGHGTCIIVALPAVASGVVSKILTSVARPSALRILVIDDEENVRNVIAEYLHADGHQVDVADGPAAGLRKINGGTYDLIMTDRSMPDMSGDELALRAKRIAPHVPILMLTGFGELMNIRGERPEGVEAVIAKPVTMDVLRAAIAHVATLDASRKLAGPGITHGTNPEDAAAVPTELALPLDEPQVGPVRRKGPPRILIADDNPAVLETVQTYLESKGFEVGTALDGNRALEMADTEAFDVLILDVHMPVYTGVEVLKMLRKRLLRHPIKVIALTADSHWALRDELQGNGVDSYLIKPLVMSQLEREITKLLNEKNTPGSSARRANHRS
jgi:PAS domain S-box-containing protein